MEEEEFVAETQTLDELDDPLPSTQILHDPEDPLWQTQSLLDTAPEPWAILTFADLRAAARPYPLFQGVNAVGRDTGAGVQISTGVLSRRHAVVELHEQVYLVYDVGSRNGTKRNGVRLEPEVRYELRDGDRVSFGGLVGVFRPSRTIPHDDGDQDEIFGEIESDAESTAEARVFDDDDDDDEDGDEEFLKSTQDYGGTGRTDREAVTTGSEIISSSEKSKDDLSYNSDLDASSRNTANIKIETAADASKMFEDDDEEFLIPTQLYPRPARETVAETAKVHSHPSPSSNTEKSVLEDDDLEELEMETQAYPLWTSPSVGRSVETAESPSDKNERFAAGKDEGEEDQSLLATQDYYSKSAFRIGRSDKENVQHNFNLDTQAYTSLSQAPKNNKKVENSLEFDEDERILETQAYSNTSFSGNVPDNDLPDETQSYLSFSELEPPSSRQVRKHLDESVKLEEVDQSFLATQAYFSPKTTSHHEKLTGVNHGEFAIATQAYPLSDHHVSIGRETFFENKNLTETLMVKDERLMPTQDYSSPAEKSFPKKVVGREDSAAQTQSLCKRNNVNSSIELEGEDNTLLETQAYFAAPIIEDPDDLAQPSFEKSHLNQDDSLVKDNDQSFLIATQAYFSSSKITESSVDKNGNNNSSYLILPESTKGEYESMLETQAYPSKTPSGFNCNQIEDDDQFLAATQDYSSSSAKLIDADKTISFASPRRNEPRHILDDDILMATQDNSNYSLTKKNDDCDPRRKCLPDLPIPSDDDEDLPETQDYYSLSVQNRNDVSNRDNLKTQKFLAENENWDNDGNDEILQPRQDYSEKCCDPYSNPIDDQLEEDDTQIFNTVIPETPEKEKSLVSDINSRKGSKMLPSVLKHTLRKSLAKRKSVSFDGNSGNTSDRLEPFEIEYKDSDETQVFPIDFNRSFVPLRLSEPTLMETQKYPDETRGKNSSPFVVPSIPKPSRKTGRKRTFNPASSHGEVKKLKSNIQDLETQLINDSLSSSDVITDTKKQNERDDVPTQQFESIAKLIVSNNGDKNEPSAISGEASLTSENSQLTSSVILPNSGETFKAPETACRRSKRHGNTTPALINKNPSENVRNLRKSICTNGMKIVFTGAVDPNAQKIVKELDGFVISSDDPKDAASQADLAIMDKENVRRTLKYLCMVGLGKPVVDFQWIFDSKLSNKFVDYRKYFISVEVKRMHESGGRVFKGLRVHVTPSVVPSPTQMRDIIVCGGGEYLNVMPKGDNNSCIIVSCSQDLYLIPETISLPVVDKEFILTGVISGNLNTSNYKLNFSKVRKKKISS